VPSRLSVVEAHDEWQVAEKRYLSETTLALLKPTDDSDDQPVAVKAAITA
jgi:putative transposase